jgi:hypothetical protein
MACACGKNKTATAAPKSYTVTARDGKKSSYKTEVEASAAARRLGGTYKVG